MIPHWLVRVVTAEATYRSAYKKAEFWMFAAHPDRNVGYSWFRELSKLTTLSSHSNSVVHLSFLPYVRPSLQAAAMISLREILGSNHDFSMAESRLES
jgi:hypothetical protein